MFLFLQDVYIHLEGFGCLKPCEVPIKLLKPNKTLFVFIGRTS